MIPVILIEGEFRSLIRNSLERFIGVNLKKKEKSMNKYLKIGFKLSIRVISSLIAIYIFNQIKSNDPEGSIKEYVSYAMIALFFYVLAMKN